MDFLGEVGRGGEPQPERTPASYCGSDSRQVIDACRLSGRDMVQDAAGGVFEQNSQVDHGEQGFGLCVSRHTGSRTRYKQGTSGDVEAERSGER